MIFQHFCFVICLVKKWKFGLKVENCSTFCIFWKFCEFFCDLLDFVHFFEFCGFLIIFLCFCAIFYKKDRYLQCFMKINCTLLFKKNKKVRSDSVIRFGWKYRKNLLIDVILCLKGNFTLLLSDNTILREFQCCLRKNKTKICCDM